MEMQFDHWEEDTTSFGDSDFEVGISEECWDASDVDPTSDDDLVAPTAEQIQSLLSMISVPAEPASMKADDKHQPAIDISPKVSVGSVSPQAIVRTPIAKPSSTVTIESLDSELREAFMDDASSCIGSIEQSLLRLESNPADAGALNQICRELHTLKGASASVGLSDLADQLHHLEDTLSDDQIASRAPDISKLLKK